MRRLSEILRQEIPWILKADVGRLSPEEELLRDRMTAGRLQMCDKHQRIIPCPTCDRHAR